MWEEHLSGTFQGIGVRHARNKINKGPLRDFFRPIQLLTHGPEFPEMPVHPVGRSFMSGYARIGFTGNGQQMVKQIPQQEADGLVILQQHGMVIDMLIIKIFELTEKIELRI